MDNPLEKYSHAKGNAKGALPALITYGTLKGAEALVKLGEGHGIVIPVPVPELAGLLAYGLGYLWNLVKFKARARKKRAGLPPQP